MARDKCRMPNCDKEPCNDSSNTDSNSFCSTFHELKYEHIKADAEQARRDEQEEPRHNKNDLPEYDGPPY